LQMDHSPPVEQKSFFFPRLNLPNPGKYEELHREAKSIFQNPELFDGFRFEILRAFKESISTSHTWSLGSPTEGSTFSFSPVVVWKKLSIWGRLDTDKRIIGKFNFNFSDTFGLTFGGSASPEPGPFGNNLTVDFDIKGRGSFLQLRYQHPRVIGCSFLRAIHPNFSIGFDTFFNDDNGVGIASGGLRWDREKSIVTLIGGANQIGCHYTKKLSEEIIVATEFTAQAQNGELETVASVGGHIQFNPFILKASLSSDGRICSFWEESLGNISKMVVSVDTDLVKQQTKFGMGFSVQF